MNVNDSVLKNEEKAVFRLRSLYGRYGYSQYQMSKFEEYDLYVRNKSFLVSDQVITFTDINGKLMALKPDVTLSIVKNTKDIPDGLQKMYYNENVYRVSGGGHSFREIMQVGAECIGAVDAYCISEMLTMAMESLREISDEFVLDVSHLDIVSAVLESLEVSEDAAKRLLTCIGEKNLHGVGEICDAESVTPQKRRDLELLITTYGEAEPVLRQLRQGLTDPGALSALDQLQEILEAIPSDPDKSRVHVDFSVISDMNYYNGIVFKGFVQGIPTRILSGGQYDRLMRRMGKRSGAVGFAVYLDLLDELSREVRAYDVDGVLLYGEGTSPAAVAKAVRQLNSDGSSVIAVRSLPEKLTYRKLWKWNGKEVELLETHA